MIKCNIKVLTWTSKLLKLLFQYSGMKFQYAHTKFQVLILKLKDEYFKFQ